MSPSRDEIPKQVRVRTDPDEGYAYRYRTIETAADRLDVNKTDAIVTSCDVVGRLLANVEKALADERLPPEVAADLAETISTSRVSIEYRAPDVDVEVD